jgi:opacity protein-like surface antigen
MKRVMMLAAAALMIGGTAQSQDVMKQTGGEKNIEVQFAPFGGSPISMGGIRYRTFQSASMAYRAEVFLGFGSNTDVIGVATNGDEATRSSNTFNIEINPGIEWHLPGTDRLSPYYGAALNLGYSRTGSKTDELGFSEGNLIVLEDVETRSDASMRLGLFAIGGFDYYFAHNIYLGAEIGFGMVFVNQFDTVTETTTGNETTTTESPNGSSFNLGPGAQARLRLGILF